MTVQASLAGGTDESVARLRAALGAADRAPLGRLDWVAALPNAAAPGFVYLAGACGGVPVGGGGRDLAEAAARLAGETAEVLAQAAAPVLAELAGDPAIDAVWVDDADPPRISAINLARGRKVGIPAAAVDPALPRRPGAPPPSLGLAAGPDRDAARLAGLLELVERDAAARWWQDGGPAHALDASLAGPASELLAGLRGPAPARATTLLELPSPTGVPVLCALSLEPGGGGLAFGLKAGFDPRDAATGAVLELMQMEIALEMARLRADRGAPAPGDSGPLARAALDPGLLAAGPARPRPAPEEGFAALSLVLARQGVEVVLADLPTPPDGLPVSKIVAAGLRPLPGDPRPPQPHAPGLRAPLM